MPRDHEQDDRAPPLFNEFDDASGSRRPDPQPEPSAVEASTLSRDFNSERENGMRNKSPPHGDIVKLINGLAYRHSAWQVFSDFCEMSALAFSNGVDLSQYETREARYMEIVKRYGKDEIAKFPEILGALTRALEGGMTDVLGKTFHELELHNKWAGQFFTPYDLCRMMAKMTLGDEAHVRELTEKNGFVRASEPAVGSGAMVIALAEAMREMGINYQQHLHVTAVDVDAKCVHMAYAQFALLHIPAVIVHGNSMSLEEFGHWYTPAHILGGWRWKLKRAAENDAATEPHKIVEAPNAPDSPESTVTERDEPPRAQLTLF